MMNPSRKSTLPSARCRFAATTDLPTIWARSVPTAKFQSNPTARKRGSGDETAADTKKSAQDANEKPDHDEINRADVRVARSEKTWLIPNGRGEIGRARS